MLTKLKTSGTTVVVAPPKDAKAFWAQVPGAGVYGQGYYTYPCNSPPSVSFNFGGQDWKMSESSFDLGKLSASSNRCVGSIVGQDVGMSAFSFRVVPSRERGFPDRCFFKM